MNDDADWAVRLAERLPHSDIQRLARAATAGETGVRQLRAMTGSVVMRDACDQLLGRLRDANPAYLSGLLAGTAGAAERARQRRSVSVVWTGPESGITSSRLTSATVTGLIDGARSSVLLVSYATAPDPALNSALSAAADRGVEITLLLERSADNPAYGGNGTPFPALEALRLHWPSASRPPGAALHAKIIVVDDSVALVGSANLTGRAIETNLECGILLRGGREPKAIRGHVMGLYSAAVLRRVSQLAPGQEPVSVFDPPPVIGFEAGDGIPLDYACPDRKIAVCSDLSPDELRGLELEGWRLFPDIASALRES